MTVSPVDPLGNLKVIFSQDMVFPSNISMFNYSTIFSFTIESASTGRIVKAKSKRRLEECTHNLNSMTIREVMVYYYEIGYYGKDNLKSCSVERMNWMKDSTPEEKVQKKEKVSIQWKVVNHTAREIDIKMSFSDPSSISSTTKGKDKLKINILDLNIFKSQASGKGIDIYSFEG